MEKKKRNKKKKSNFFNTLKPIIIFSFIINIVLLSYIYYLKNNHHAYFFAGKDEYLNVDGGVINLNYDINLLSGNNIEYIGDDINIKKIKIGYYILEDESLKEIITHYETFEKSTSLKETINSITSFNVSEVAKNSKLFSKINGKNIENNLYVVMEVTDEEGKEIVSKISLDVSKLY